MWLRFCRIWIRQPPRGFLSSSPIVYPKTESSYAPARNLYCVLVNGTAESLPWRTSGESANNLFDLTSASETGLGIGLPALILIWGFLGSEASTETTVAVPTALFSSPV